MSFGYAVDDVIAVLSLFERIATELRSYKDAPNHFQNLSFELDLIRKALQQVLCLDPEDEIERETLEQVRAIVLRCQQPLQAWVSKTRSKGASLGHLQSTRKDVDELRKTILSEMGAITLLMGVRQMNQIQRLANQVANGDYPSSSAVKKECSAISRQTSKILGQVSMTPQAIADLRYAATAQSEHRPSQISSLEQGIVDIRTHMGELAFITTDKSISIRRYVTQLGLQVEMFCALLRDIELFLIDLTKSSTKMLPAISRNTILLLEVARQLKKATCLVNAIPQHLTLDLVRLEDALGESWALPFQACQTFDCFYDTLKNVVYPSNRPGFDRIRWHHITTTLSGRITKLNKHNWIYLLRPGMHIKQASTVPRSYSNMTQVSKKWPYLGCSGFIARQDGPLEDGCSTAGRWMSNTRETAPVTQTDSNPSSTSDRGSGRTEPARSCIGLKLPSIRFSNHQTHMHSLRNGELKLPEVPVNSLQEAETILSIDPRNPTACTYMALTEMQSVDHYLPQETSQHLARAKQLLETAVEAGSLEADTYYLLGRVYLGLMELCAAHDSLQQAVSLNPQAPLTWNTIGVLFFRNHQYIESLDNLAQAIRSNPHCYVPWYNLAVLYGNCGQRDDAIDAIEICAIRNPPPHVSDRLNEWLRTIDSPDLSAIFKHEVMRDSELRLLSVEVAGSTSRD